jgi:hypothetical protein
MTAFKDSSFLSAVIFSFNLCHPAQYARHLRKLSLPTFVRAECSMTEAQYSEVLWGGGLPARGPCGGVVAGDFFPRPQYSVLFCDVKLLDLRVKKNGIIQLFILF